MNNVQAYLKSDPSQKMPDIQFLFRVAPLDAGPYLPPFKPAYLDGYGVRAVVLRPKAAATCRSPRPIRTRRSVSRRISSRATRI